MRADYQGMTTRSFRFRLERVRALRERTEDVAKQALAGAMQDHLRSEAELAAAAERVARARAAQLDAGALPTRAIDLVAHQAYLERSERAHHVTREDHTLRERELEQRRVQLTAAARDRQALERLKEHRRSDHQREMDRQEGMALDEIAINGFRRRAAA